MSQEKEKVSIQGILNQLAAGKTRKEIAADMGISYAAAQKHIFSHPKLQNRKTRPVADFELVDDAPDAPVATPRVKKEEVATEGAEEVAEVVTEEVATEKVEDASADLSEGTAAWRE